MNGIRLDWIMLEGRYPQSAQLSTEFKAIIRSGLAHMSI